MRCSLIAAVLLATMPASVGAKAPVAADARLVVELFAAAPDIVQPIAASFDSHGRLLVVESHTHFRPAKYDGPKYDRVRILEDTNGDGKADKFTTFFEGTTATMDLAVHPNGAVYLATRNEILRLRDTNRDGQADEKARIAFLDTTGNYPHNGLSGLTIDARGDLYFGMGENLGVPYKLLAADGSKIEGGGEGGNFFWITAEGKKLRRVATGFWNPFGACRDIYGRIFVVDNDPDSSPPCRLLQIVEGGDYGYQFRYGRAGRHPFQAWNGELPGTLPMVAGTGESPCEVVAYESDGLPAEYLGDLLVPAWADHRVERYVPKAQGAGTTSIRRPFIQGDNDFYPSGLSVAPDGSLFVTDWGSKSYELHGKGAVWHVRWKDARPAPRQLAPERALASPHRSEREAAARSLAQTAAGLDLLRNSLQSTDVRVRITALDILIASNAENVDLASVARSDKEPLVRALAVRGLVARGADSSEFLAETQPACLRVEAINGVGLDALPALLKLLGDTDPYMRHAAIHKLGSKPEWLDRMDLAKLNDARQQTGTLLACRATGAKYDSMLTKSLASDDLDLRLLAAKWIADDRLVGFRPNLLTALKNPGLDPRTLIGLTTALARLDDKPVNEDALAGYFIDQLKDAKVSAALRLMALRAIPASNKSLRLELLTDLLRQSDPALRLEALRALADKADVKAATAVRSILIDQKQPSGVRAQAVVTLAALNQLGVNVGIELVAGGDSEVRDEALRALNQARMTDDQRHALAAATKNKTDCADLVARVLGQPFHAKRPLATETAAWLKHLNGRADAAAGRRIFENPRVSTCANCHRVDGRGANIGPDLSTIGRTDRKWLVESLLQPSAVVAPHYQAWRIATIDNRVLTGLLVHTYLDEAHYVDAKGTRFKVLAGEAAEVTAARESIMPAGLLDTLTDQEIRDLLAYLTSRK